MKLIILYSVTALILLGMDIVGLRFIVKPVFDRHVAHLLAEPMRVGPAALFYLGYVAGVVWFVSMPAMRLGDPTAALIGGVALGLMAYGTYEFTNYATLRDWSMEQVVVDTLWGGLLTGFSAWAGVLISRAVGVNWG